MNQSQLKALLLALNITPSDRLKYFDILAQIDSASSLLEAGTQAVLSSMDTAMEQIAPETLFNSSAL